VAWLLHSPCLQLTYFHHMVVALESFHGCLLASCIAPPSFWATEDDPSYTTFLFYSFLLVQEILPLSNFASLEQINSAPCWKEERQLAPSPLISTNLFSFLHVLDPKEILTRRKIGFLAIFSRNHPPKIPLTHFLGHQLASGFLLVTEWSSNISTRN
jgi:hypothetical protein